MDLSLRFLTDGDFAAVHRAWLEGFGDYAVRFELSEAQLRELVRRRGYRPELSVGAFDGPRLVAFTLNGAGTQDGVAAAYDTGTAVVPEYRRRGLGRQMFGLVAPELRARGYRRYVLEVLESNAGAVALYETEGFTVSRRLVCFALDRAPVVNPASEARFAVRDARADWNLFRDFCDWPPSWQNSIESIGRSQALRRTIAAFAGNTCVGYAVVFPESCDLAQLAVAPDARHRGAGTQLLEAAVGTLPSGASLRILNIDGSASGTIGFLQASGARETVSQFEMILPL